VPCAGERKKKALETQEQSPKTEGRSSKKIFAKTAPRHKRTHTGKVKKKKKKKGTRTVKKASGREKGREERAQKPDLKKSIPVSKNRR